MNKNIQKSHIYILISLLSLFLIFTGYRVFFLQDFSKSTIFGLSILLLLMFLFFFRYFLEIVISFAVNRIIMKPCTQISDGLFQMSQGTFDNYIEKIPSGSKVLSFFKNRSITTLVNKINEIIVNFNSLTFEPCNRMCFVGPDPYQAGRCAGEQMGKILGGKGKVAIITWITRFSYIFWMRQKGFVDYIVENHPDIKLVAELDGQRNDEVSYALTNQLTKKFPDLKGIFVTTVRHSAGVGKAIFETGLAGRVHVVTMGNHQDVNEYVAKGVSSNIPDDTFQIGYDPVILVYNYLAAKEKPETPRNIIRDRVLTKDNITYMWDFKTGFIENEESAKRLKKPVDKKPDKHVKIAMVEFEDNDFCRQIHSGMSAAGNTLKDCNTSVKWIDLFEYIKSRTNLKVSKFDPTKGISKEIWRAGLTHLVEDGYDAIITQVLDDFLIPIINDISKKGCIVATNNIEPISMRGFLSAIKDQTEGILNLSNEVSDVSDEVNHATTDIIDSMQHVSNGATNQQAQSIEIKRLLESHLHTVKNITDQSKEGSIQIEKAGNSIRNGEKNIKLTLSNMDSIKGSVEKTGSGMEKLGSFIGKIDSIINVINDVSAQTHILSINAMIQSAKAGKAGKPFSVVANEIKSLAFHSAGAAKEIDQLIAQIQNHTFQAKQYMNQAVTEVQESSKVTKTTKTAMDGLNDALDLNNRVINSINNELENVKKFAEEISHSMESNTTISAENSKVTEEVSATIESVSDLIEKVTISSKKFKNLAMGTIDFMKKFTV